MWVLQVAWMISVHLAQVFIGFVVLPCQTGLRVVYMNLVNYWDNSERNSWDWQWKWWPQICVHSNTSYLGGLVCCFLFCLCDTRILFCIQDTLEEANALLNELEARDSRQAAQVTGSSDKNQTSENNSMEQNTSNQSNLDRIEGWTLVACIWPIFQMSW